MSQAGNVRSATLELHLDGATEMVTARRGPEGWTLVCTARDAKPYLTEARRILGIDDDTGDGSGPGKGGGGPGGVDPLSVAGAVDDLVTAVVRAGVDAAGENASVREALDNLVAVVPDPLPVDLDRLLDRLREAWSADDVVTAAHLLDGLTRVADALRDERPSTRRNRVLGYVDAGGRARRQHVGRHLVELGRERVASTTAEQAERRYLIDLEDGQIYREEVRIGGDASVGPCPRYVSVDLAEVNDDAPPRSLRLLQYAISPDVRGKTWERVAARAKGNFGDLASRFRRSQRSHPGFAEPVVLLKPASTDRHALVDATGGRLALDPSGGDGTDAAFLADASENNPAFVTGRLVRAADGLRLRVLAALYGEPAEGHFVRYA